MNSEAAAGPPAGAPLSHLRVLDLTRLLPGPMCTQYLADLGADVIKIEDTGIGDYARTLDPPPPDAPDAATPFYRAINRNKRSLAIDLKHPRGRELFFALTATADVIVEGFRPGVVASLGIDYAAVSARHPRIVYASISGYGQDGPRRDRAGHDINYLGYAGVLEQTGTQDGPPALSNLQVADLLGGAASAAIAILAATVDAQRSGRGRFVDVAMADASLAHNVFPLHALLQWGELRARGDDLLTGGVACYNVYRTADGRHVAVGALEEKFWRLLCATIGRDDLLPQRLARGEAGAKVKAELAAIFGGEALAHWERVFADVDCCVTPIRTLAEALDDPQFVARSMIVKRKDGSVAIAPPFKLSGHEFAITREAPAQGGHTREIIGSLGLSDSAVDDLVASGVVRDAAD